MNKEEITALASEYAEEKGKKMEREQGLPNCLLKEVMGMDVEELINFLQWLLRRYCLVEKSKAIQIYQAKQHILANQDVFGISTATEAAAQKRLMLCLFPDLRKEVEE